MARAAAAKKGGDAFARLLDAAKPAPKMWMYRERVVGVDESVRVFGEMRALVERAVEQHGQPRVVVAGQSFEQRRRVAYFSCTTAAYTYSGARPPNAGWPPILQRLADIASQLAADIEPGKIHVFDSALVNLYRNGSDTSRQGLTPPPPPLS